MGAQGTPSLDIPSFRVAGLVTEKRELTGKDGKPWLWSVKVMAMGGTFELSTKDQSAWNAVPQGATGVATGRFEAYGSNWRFILDKWAAA